MKIIAATFCAAAALGVTAAFAGHHEKKDGMDHDAKLKAHFEEVDANGDGQVTEEEMIAYHTAKAREMFAEIAGDDGVATFDELKAHKAAKHEEKKAMMKEKHDGKMEDKAE
jgi:Ca2+-binding EF-hand superfamily protein